MQSHILESSLSSLTRFKFYLTNILIKWTRSNKTAIAYTPVSFTNYGYANAYSFFYIFLACFTIAYRAWMVIKTNGKPS